MIALRHEYLGPNSVLPRWRKTASLAAVISETTSPPSAAPRVPIDPSVEELDAWFHELGKFVRAQPQEFLARLPELKRAAAERAQTDPPDIARVRGVVLRLLESSGRIRARENDLAEIAVRDALQTLEALLPETSTPGLAVLARMLIGYCYMNVGNVAFNRSDPAEALRGYLHARDIALTAGIPKLLGLVLGNIGVVYGGAGMWEKQIEFARESRRICEEVHDEMAAANADVNMAEVYRNLKDFTASRQTSERGLEIARRNGWKEIELCARMALAFDDFQENQPASAIRRLNELESLSAEVARPHLEATRLTGLAEAHAAVENRQEARDLLTTVIAQYAPILTRRAHAYAYITLARVEIALGALTDAKSHATEAVRLLASSDPPFALEVQAHEALAEAAQAQGDWETACREERARHEAYARHFNHQADLRTRVLAVQHQIDIARAAAERERVQRQRVEELLADLATRLQEADATPRARTPEEITPDDLRPLGLTARESEVLLWVARGKTNDEIAIILGCGAETVKSHLKHIYLQLDVTNRAAAAAAALQPVPSAAKLTHANTKSAMRS